MLGKIQYICGQNLWHIEDTEYSDKVIIHVLAEEDKIEEIKKEIIESSSGKIEITKSEEGIYFKEENRLFKVI